MSLPRLRAHPNGHFLVTEDDQPFFWLGDTAWTIFHRLNREEIIHYCVNRQRKGFNVIQVMTLIEQDGLNTPNIYGERPLIDNDPTRPNEAYFQRLDDYLTLAEQHGLYVALLPTWADKVTPNWGIGPVIFNPENAEVYGRWLTQRWGTRSHIIWCLGGDRPPTKGDQDWRPIWRGMAAGIHSVLGETALLTYHPDGGYESGATIYAEAWSDLVMIQSGHWARETAGWDWVNRLYQLSPSKPVLDAEPNYEDHPAAPWPTWDPESGYFRDYEVRKQTYRTVFAGGAGVTYGHHSIWQSYSERVESINYPQFTWREALDRPAAGQMVYLRRLIESRPMLERIPDQSLLTTIQTGRGEHQRACRDAAGRYALLYLPVFQTVQVNCASLSGEMLRAWWYNPRTGQASHIGDFPSAPRLTFTPPVDGPDWVLVLDDAAQGYDAPGIR